MPDSNTWHLHLGSNPATCADTPKPAGCDDVAAGPWQNAGTKPNHACTWQPNFTNLGCPPELCVLAVTCKLHKRWETAIRSHCVAVSVVTSHKELQTHTYVREQPLCFRRQYQLAAALLAP